MDAPKDLQHLDEMKKLTRDWMSAQPIVLAYIRTAVSDYTDAEDVLQAVAQDVVSKYSQYDSARPFIGWALWLSKSRIIDFYRKSQRDRHVFGPAVMEQLADACAELPVTSQSRLEAMEHCIAKLPSKSGQILAMRYFDDEKPAAIADAMQTTSGTIRVTLTRIRKALYQCIHERLEAGGEHA